MSQLQLSKWVSTTSELKKEQQISAVFIQLTRNCQNNATPHKAVTTAQCANANQHASKELDWVWFVPDTYWCLVQAAPTHNNWEPTGAFGSNKFLFLLCDLPQY